MEWSLKKNKKLLLALLLLLGGGTLVTAIAVPLALNKKTKDETPEVKEYKFIEGLKDADGKIMLFNGDDELKAYVTANWESGNLISSAMTSKYEILGESFDTKDLAMAHLLSVAPIESIDVVVTGAPAYDANGMLTNDWVQSTGTQTVYKGALATGGATNTYTNVEDDAYESLLEAPIDKFFSGLHGINDPQDTRAEAEESIYAAKVANVPANDPAAVTPAIGATFTTDTGVSAEYLAEGTYSTPEWQKVDTDTFAFQAGDTYKRVGVDVATGESELVDATFTYQDATSGLVDASWNLGMIFNGSMPGANPTTFEELGFREGDVIHIGMIPVVLYEPKPGSTDWYYRNDTTQLWSAFIAGPLAEVVPDEAVEHFINAEGQMPAGTGSDGQPFSTTVHENVFHLTDKVTSSGQRIWDAFGAAADWSTADHGAGLPQVPENIPAGWTGKPSDPTEIFDFTSHEFYAQEVFVNEDPNVTEKYTNFDGVQDMTNDEDWYDESAKANMSVSDTSGLKIDTTGLTFYPKAGNTATDGTGDLVSDITLAEGYSAGGWTTTDQPGTSYATEQEAKDATDITTIFQKVSLTGGYVGDLHVALEDDLETAKSVVKGLITLETKVVAGDVPATGDDFDSLVVDAGTITLQKVTGIDDKVFKDEDSAKLHYQTVEEANIAKVDTTTYTADATIFGSTIKPNTDVTALITEIVTSSETIKEDAIDDSKHGAIPTAASIVLPSKDLY